LVKNGSDSKPATKKKKPQTKKLASGFSRKYLLVSPSFNAGNYGFLAVVFSQLFLRLTQCEQSATAGQYPLSTVCAAVKEAVDQSNSSSNSDSIYLVNHLVKGTVLLALGQRLDQLGCLLH
jgi:hypothetical protein